MENSVLLKTSVVPSFAGIKDRLSQEALVEAMGRARAKPGNREILAHSVHPGTSKARQFSIAVGFLTMEIPFDYWMRNNSLDKYISSALIGKIPNAYPEEGLNPIYFHPNDLRDFGKKWSEDMEKLIRYQNSPELYQKELYRRSQEVVKLEYYYFILTSLTTGLNYLVISLTQAPVRMDFTAYKTYIERSFAVIDERQAPATGGMDEVERAIKEIDLRLQAYKEGYIEKKRQLGFFSLEGISMILLQNSVFREVERQAEEQKQIIRNNGARISGGKFSSADEYRNSIRAKVIPLSSMAKGHRKAFQLAGVQVVYLHAGEAANHGTIGRLGFLSKEGGLIADVPTNDTRLTAEQEPVAYKSATDRVFEHIKKNAR